VKTRHSIFSPIVTPVAIALAGTALLSAPALAQRTSTPAEQAQTNDLNRQAVDGIKSEADTQAYDQAQKNYQEQKATYEEKQKQYLDSKDSYEQKKAASDESHAQYQTETAEYKLAHPQFPSDRDLVELDTVAPRTLIDAPVDSTDGAHIGHVARVRHHGRDLTLDVAVGSDRQVSLLGDSLRFDRGNGVILTASPGDRVLAESQPGLPAR
jgi:hypothetical protein